MVKYYFSFKAEELDEKTKKAYDEIGLDEPGHILDGEGELADIYVGDDFDEISISVEGLTRDVYVSIDIPLDDLLSVIFQHADKILSKKYEALKKFVEAMKHFI